MFVLMLYLVCEGPGKTYFWALKGLEKTLNFVLPKGYESLEGGDFFSLDLQKR